MVAVAAQPRHTLHFPTEVELHQHSVAVFSFLASNERQYEKFRTSIPKERGWYVGIGSFQNYSLMGKHKYAVLADLDPAVSVLHEFGTDLLRKTEQPDQFVQQILQPESWDKYWDKLSLHNLVRSSRYNIMPDSSTKESRVHAARCNDTKNALQHYFEGLRAWCINEQGKPESFLGNPEIFSEARDLALQCRIKIICIDAFGEAFVGRLVGLAEYSGTPITTMYLSNAIAWFLKNKKMALDSLKLLQADNPTLLFTSKSAETANIKEWLYWKTSAELLARTFEQVEDCTQSDFYKVPLLQRENFVSIE